MDAHTESNATERDWRILLAEDSEQDARFFRKLLESSPDIRFTLHHCSTTEEILSALDERRFDVVFLDFALAEPDQFNCVGALAHQAPHLPILVMTGVDNQHLGVQAIHKGAQDYLVRGTVSAANIWRIIRYAVERKRTQDSLIRHLGQGPEGENQFRILVDQTPEAILVVDESGIVQYANPAAGQCLGKTRSELEHSPSPVRITPEQLVDRDIMIDNKPHILEVQAVNAQWAGNLAHVATLRDVTEARRQQRERDAENPEVQRAQAAESLACLAGGIAHDYRNLLMGILGNASLALMELDKDVPAREYLDQIRDAARRASDLTNKMLTYSGRHHFRFASVDLSELTDDIKPVVTPSSPTNVELNFEIPDTLPPLVADADHLRQALMNLLVNSWEALDDEPGKVALRAGQSTLAETEGIVFSFLNRENPDQTLLWIEVEDTGPGIPKDLRHRVFDPFYSTKFTGRGLGLSTVLGVMRGHSGAIAVQAPLAGGARIRLLFPAVRETAEETRTRPKVPSAATSLESGKARVLVVDDEPIVLNICRRYLTANGFEVVTAADGEQAVDIFQAKHKDIQAVILDLNMPRMNGREALRQFQAIDPTVGIVISTGFAAAEIRKEFENLGASDVLEKPYEPERLINALHETIKKKPKPKSS
ncbi:MAG: response regulator [Verrucomicrobiota bacterium]